MCRRSSRLASPVAAVAVAALALGPWPASHAATAGSAAALPGQLYFTRDAAIYRANPDGSGARRLTEGGPARNPDFLPAVSRDGARLAYVQYREGGPGDRYGIYVLPAAGGTRRDLSGADQSPLWPTWSPDGAELAYDTNLTFYGIAGGTYPAFVTRNVATGKATGLFGNRYHPQLAPTWSPDGSAIAAEQLSTSGPLPRSIGLAVVYVGRMRAQPAALRSTEIEAPLTADPVHDYLVPAYSPDGRQIACVRAPVGKTTGALWVLNSDGTGGRALAQGALNFRPAWSPDGREIAYSDGNRVVIASARTGAVVGTIANAYGAAWGGQVALAPVAQKVLLPPAAANTIAIGIVSISATYQGTAYRNLSGLYDDEPGQVVVPYTETGTGTVTGTITVVRKTDGHVLASGPLAAGAPGTMVFDLVPHGAADEGLYVMHITLRVGSAAAGKDQDLGITPPL